jgi:hypothetical protein
MHAFKDSMWRVIYCSFVKFSRSKLVLLNWRNGLHWIWKWKRGAGIGQFWCAESCRAAATLHPRPKVKTVNWKRSQSFSFRALLGLIFQKEVPVQKRFLKLPGLIMSCHVDLFYCVNAILRVGLIDEKFLENCHIRCFERCWKGFSDTNKKLIT